MKKICFVLSAVFLFASCNEISKKDDLKVDKEITESMSFSVLTENETGIDFNNKIIESDSFNFFKYEYAYNGGGVAVGDVNNDGLVDIYFTGNQVSDKLYLNKGDFVFEDVTEKAIGVKTSEGWHTGVSMVDVNQDGWLDIYVCRSGIPVHDSLRSNLLYINKGDGTFDEQGEEFGVDCNRKTTQAVFFDYDNDGDLDLYVLNHPNQNKNKKKKSVGFINDLIKAGSPDSDVMLENVNGHFEDVSSKSGISNHAYGLGIAASDVNNDGYIDLYISNDYMAPDNLYMNNGDGTFTDEANSQLKHMSNYSMGNDISDFNNDGLLDIMTVDMASEDHVRSKKNMGGMSTKKFWDAVSVGYHYQYMFNALQMNNGNGTFSDVAQIAGVSKTDWSWAPLFVDFDNDGNKDLFISNGYKRDTRDNDYMNKANHPSNKDKGFQELLDMMPTQKIQNYIYKNEGGVTFTKKNKAWGVDVDVNSNGAAYADFDNDGDIDLVTNNMESVSAVIRNDLMSSNSFLQLKIIKGNHVLYGTKVTVVCGDKRYYQELQVTRGFQSSVDNVLHFGLGNAKKVDRIEIVWPNGETSVKKDVVLNKLNILNSDIEPISDFINVKDSTFFELDSKEFDIRHRELFVNDFSSEVLLPNKMSQLGPFMSVGDVNNDGLEDFYLSGSVGFSGQLLIQSKSGAFDEKSGPWQKQLDREEMGSNFFDVDNDGDLDLYVVSGGNEYDVRSEKLYDQLYINDGKGNFENESYRLPFMETSGQRITIGDYDKDGDIDIFIGGRQTPGFYPIPPRSYLLRNDNGNFIDVTTESLDLMGPGLITESVFDDFDQDGDLDLICVGEWMPISFFENNNNHFTNVTNKFGFSNEVGWWSSITVGDFNNDGKNDYVVGNLGENNKFHPSQKKPLEIYCHDFDGSGTFDIVLAKYQNGTCFPVRGKQCSSEQMPFVSKKFSSYDEFALADLETIYGSENLDEAINYSATNFSSVVLMSSNNVYNLKRLNDYAQVSPINAGICLDLNKDGNLDFIGVGNNYGAEVETTRYDSGVGIVLLGDGEGGFKNISSINSGFFSNSDDKDVIIINNFIVVSSNNKNLKRFKIR